MCGEIVKDIMPMVNLEISLLARGWFLCSCSIIVIVTHGSIYIFVIGLYVYPLLPIYAEYATVSSVGIYLHFLHPPHEATSIGRR